MEKYRKPSKCWGCLKNMGVNLKDLVLKHEIKLEDLSGKRIAIDAFNHIFQFLSTVRQADGTPLMDSKGNTTSHLSGIFYRTINLLEAGVQPCFVFDGQAPAEKASVQEERGAIREEARLKHKEALERGDLEEARKFAQQTSRLTAEMIAESKELISAMGLPWCQAIGEGEAQAALMAKKGHVWAVASQDYDTLLFGAPRLIRNLSISGKKKSGTGFVEVKPEILELAETLNYLQMDIEMFVKLGLLIGTDYNPKGVEGVGPKTALKVIRENKFLEYVDRIPNWEKLQGMFLRPLVTTDYALEWKNPDVEKIKEILCTRHEFSEDRITSALQRINKASPQKGLRDFV
jgi:flap endonuclease-1